ncbi:MAG: prepilin peptidase [Pseudomonadota bacterium]
MLHTPSLAALIFLSAALPLGLYTVWSDLSRMKIPNHVTDLLFVLFVILGFFALPWEDYLWRYANFAGGLAFGFLFYATGSMGAGDSKFIAAALPYVAAADLIFTGMIFAAALLGAWVTHKLVAMSPLRRLAPDWASWHAGPKHPMGIALSATLIVYLGLCAIQ